MIKSHQELTILVIEDNDGDYLLVQEHLVDMFSAAKIDRAKNFEEAERILAIKVPPIDTVLLDLSLPDKAGEPLIVEVLKRAANIPVIILTGNSDEQFSVTSLSLGVSDYILKDELNSIILYKSIVYSIERNKNLVTLKESEQRYFDLFNFSPLPMWVIDIESQKFVDANQAAIHHYGYSREEFLTMSMNDLSCKSLSLLKNLQPDEVLQQNKSNEDILVELQSSSLNYNGRPAKIVSAFDITERKRQMDAIEEQNEKLREIAWTQSHMVRGPLATLMGLLQIFQQEYYTVQEKHKMLSLVQSAATKLDLSIRKVVNNAQDVKI